MWSIHVDQMVCIDEQMPQIFYFGGVFGGIYREDRRELKEGEKD